MLDRPLYSPPKPVLASELMSCANIGGMFFPFTMESNINVDNPFFVVPWTMTHELAHQCGFMREDEANFIAYLACKQSDDALMRYSGYLLAYDNAVSALRKVDPEAAKAIGSGAVGGGAARPRPARGALGAVRGPGPRRLQRGQRHLPQGEQPGRRHAQLRPHGGSAAGRAASRRGGRLAPEPRRLRFLQDDLGGQQRGVGISLHPGSSFCALALRGLDLLFFPTGSIEWKSYNDRGSVESLGWMRKASRSMLSTAA